MTASTTITAPARAGKGKKKNPGTLVLHDAPAAAAAVAVEPDPTADTRDVALVALVVSSLNVAHREPDQDLIDSVREHHVIQRIIVRWVTEVMRKALGLPLEVLFEIVCGERRFKAARLAGYATIPVEVRHLTDEEAFDLANAENLQRQDLSPMQEAHLCATHRVRFGRDVTQIAVRMSKSVRWVEQRLALQNLPAVGQDAMHARRMLLGVALEVAALPHVEQREEALKLCLRPAGVALMQVGEARDVLSRFHLTMSAAAFDQADAELVPAAGPCTACPKRTGTQTVLSFEGIDDIDRCLDPACWRMKADAHWQAAAAAAAPLGVAVLDMKAGGREAEAAHLTLANPRARNLVNLDSVCDIAGDALVKPALANLEAAQESGIPEAIILAESEVARAEAAADKLTWRSVVGKWVPPVVLVRELRGAREQIVELGSEQMALEALRDEGYALPPDDAEKLEQRAKLSAELTGEVAEPDGPEEEALPPPRKAPAWQVEARVGELLVERVVDAVVPAAEKARAWSGPTLWGAVVQIMGRSVQPDALRRICERRSWQPARSQGETLRDVFDARAARLPDAKLRGLLVELLACSSVEASRALGAAFGLDVKKMTSAARKAAQTTLTAGGART